MSRQLVNAAREMFSKIPGAVEKDLGSAVSFTVTPAQMEKFCKTDPGMLAIAALEEAQEPCWNCSKSPYFFGAPRRRPPGKIGSPVGGSFSGGPAGRVARTLKDEKGRCGCGAVTTPRQLKLLLARDRRNTASLRRRLNRP